MIKELDQVNSRVIIYIVIASILSFFLVNIEGVKTYKEPQEVCKRRKKDDVKYV